MTSSFTRMLFVLACALPAVAIPRAAAAEPCFASDTDGVYDQDGLANGIITITTASESDVPPASTPYDCAVLDFVVESSARLVLQGDLATGAVAALVVGDLVIEADGVIEADEQGCTSGASGPGFGPDDANVCVSAGPGAAGAGNDFGGSGGGGHGGDGGGGGVGAGGTTHDSATLPARFGASGGNTGAAIVGGGTGGGVVSITATSLVHDGVISVNGGAGGGNPGRVTGGGAGGSIFISTATLGGTTGTFQARGGDGTGAGGAGGGGGGGGGRIALLFDAATFLLDSTDFDVSGGSGHVTGDSGTVFTRDGTANVVRIFHGFTFADEDHSVTSWITDPLATNQYCDRTIAADATPSISAADVVLGGTLDCTPEIASFEVVQTGLVETLTLLDDTDVRVNGSLTLEAATSFVVGANASIANTKRGTDLVLAIPDGNNQAWNGVTIDGAREGRVVIDAAIALSLLGGTTVAGNPVWPALTTLTIDATSAIDADGRGCDARATGGSGSGAAPDASNVCANGNPGGGGAGNDFGGAGGGGHGGEGSAGGVGAGGLTYGSATAPALFGASGGNTGGTSAAGGAGGGLVSIAANAVVLEGTISANGSAGAGGGGRVTGGGSGGSIFLSASSLSGTTGTFAARGGDGVTDGNSAGGGGGGRVAVSFDTSTFAFDAADFDMAGGAGNVAGDQGTVYVRDSTTSVVRVFHGFTFADVDHEASSWLADVSATNQYCDREIAAEATPSITAADVSLGGVIVCVPVVAGFEVGQTGPTGALTLPDDAVVSVNGALTLDAATSLSVGNGATIANTRRATDLLLTVPDGNDQTWRGVTIDGAQEGRMTIDGAVALRLLEGTTVRGNPQWLALTGLTIDATSVVDADLKGCDAAFAGGGSPGMAPDCSNVCTRGRPGSGGGGNDFGSSGGGGHGGAGGNGGVGAGGSVYDLEVDPRLFGASAGNTGGGAAAGGAGGGLVEIIVDGIFANDGLVSADGGNAGGGGGRVVGAGSGGTLNITADEYACTTGGGFSVAGGDGTNDQVQGGGGGGGGRVVIDVVSDTCAIAPIADLTAVEVAPGGPAGPSAQPGTVGTLRFGDTRACADPRAFRAEAGAVRDHAVSATDALFVLQAAVGSQCCSLCVCDVNGAQDITATDALITLRRAVGQAVELLCPPCG